MKILTTLAIAALLLTGCAKKNQTPEAVKEGVIRDISKTFNVGNMDVVVDSVSFRDKEADATVSFMLKGQPASSGMTMRYVMEQHSDGQWYIKSRASSAGAAGASGAMPAGHPAMGAPAAGSETPAPAAATSASGSKFNLPPGHPDLGQ